MDAPHRKRCHRRNTPGDAHYLTFSCYRRRAFLGRDRARQWCLAALAAALERHDFALLAWVIMPEHVHLLVRPQRREYSISRFLNSVKLPVARRAVAWLKASDPAGLAVLEDRQPNGQVTHRFWQRGGGYDRNLYSAEEMWEKIEYIHANPCRRELVTVPTAWEWLSARDYAGWRVPPRLPLAFGTLPW